MPIFYQYHGFTSYIELYFPVCLGYSHLKTLIHAKSQLLIFVFFFLTSQLSFKAILKPNLNSFLIESNVADGNPSLHLRSYSTQKPQGSSDIYIDLPFLTTHIEPFNSKTIGYSSLHSSPSFQIHPVPPLSILNILCAHLLLIGLVKWANAYMHAESLQSCPTLCNPMESSPPGSSVQGIL